jgi:hypothetical protein
MVERLANILYWLCCTAAVCFVMLGVIFFAVGFSTEDIFEALGAGVAMLLFALGCWVVSRAIRP